MDLPNLNNYTIIRSIGSGTFGEVFKIKDIKTGKMFAAKISKQSLDEFSDDFYDNLNNEISIISKIIHPLILKFVGICKTNFQNENYPTIITDYLPNGCLNDILELSSKGMAPDEWDETLKLINIYGIASAMAFLHTNNIAHLDLKPENILIDEYLHPVIADFGLSKEIKGSTTSSKFIGTPLYAAPEIHEKYEYSTKSDVYSYALIVYEILTNFSMNLLKNQLKTFLKN